MGSRNECYSFLYLDELWLSEGGDDLAAGDEGQPLDAVKVCVLDGHDALVGEQLLGVVVDELAVDEHVDVVLADQLHLERETDKISCSFRNLTPYNCQPPDEPENNCSGTSNVYRVTRQFDYYIALVDSIDSLS